jgi:drug/metabolite transporter (DMT)-like permease
MKSKGVYYMLLALLFFASMNVLVKYIPRIGAVEIVFVRSVVSLIISYVVLKKKKIHLWGNNKKWLIIRGIAGSIGLLFFFTSIKVMPLGSAIAIQYLSPIFTSLLGIFIVKEKVNSWQWFFFALAFVGVIAIQGFDSRVTLEQALIGVGGALGAGMAYNSIRKLKDSDHPLVIIFYFPLVTIPVTGIYLLTNWLQPTLFEFAILIAIGVVTQFAQYYMTKAYQADTLSKVSSIQYLGMVFALGFGYFLFDETYNFKSGMGIMIIIIAVVLNVLYKNKTEKVEEYQND